MKLTPDVLADMVVSTIKGALDGPLVAGRIARLEGELAEARQEIAQLKARPMPKYCGVYQDGAAYSVGDLVTKAGGLWFCADATTTTPGTAGAWRLIVKSGRA